MSDAPAAPPKKSDLPARVASAVVLAPVVLGAVWLGGWAYVALLAVAAIIGLWEWVRLTDGQAKWPVLAPMAMLLLSAGASVALALTPCGSDADLIGRSVFILLPGAFVAGLWTAWKGNGRAPWLTGLGLPYLGFGLFSLLILRNEVGCALSPGAPLFWDDGSAQLGTASPEEQRGALMATLLLLLMVWATDIGAYFSGRTIGGPKIAPRISPKKTWAGLIGGAICAALVGVLFVQLEAAPLSMIWAALLGVLVAVVGQAGDFFESWAKRKFGVKDSSNIIPGHGGVLDRIDALLFAAPLFLLIWKMAA